MRCRREGGGGTACAGSRVSHPRRKWDTCDPGRAVSQATDFFTRARRPRPREGLPLPPQKGELPLPPHGGGQRGRGGANPERVVCAHEPSAPQSGAGCEPGDSPYPLTEGDSKSGGTEGGQRKVPPLKGDKGGFPLLPLPPQGGGL